MMVRDGDAGISSNYTAIRGVLKGVGREVQIYVAPEDIDNVSSGLIQDLIVTFDDRIYPLMARQMGTARDVDGDGRFTILLSSWLDHLGGGRCPVDGFVRVADLDPAYRCPFGNQCDMMYLNAALKAGPHVRTVMAHEYMHAVVFSQKSLRGDSGGRQMMDEEGWLDEAIAHLAEDLNGFSTSNIDYRVSAFLTSPERYQLVVDDYYAADLFRSHGSRGSTYLFLRWCVDRYGADLLPTLVHSRLRGAANLEAATGSTFADLYRRWSLALFLSGLEPSRDKAGLPEDGFRSINMRAPCEDWELAGPRFTRVSADGSSDCWPALGTTSHFAVVESSPTGAVEIEVAGPPEAELQVTVLPLGADLPRLDLAVSKLRGPGGSFVSGRGSRSKTACRYGCRPCHGSRSRRPPIRTRPVFDVDGSICWASPRRLGRRLWRPPASCARGPSRCRASHRATVSLRSRSLEPMKKAAGSPPGPKLTPSRNTPKDKVPLNSF